jgi:phosphoribosyl 1,2-cyclic phosphate phosphodiesterase
MSGSRTFTFLGTGTSVGVPMIGCECAVCTSPDPRNQRTRSSVLVTTPRGRVLVDTGPDLRAQFLRERVPFAHAVLFTHYHADHLFGLDDLRVFPKHLGGPVPLYCSAEVEGVIRQAFSYAFAANGANWVPQLAFHRVSTEPFEVLGDLVTPVPLHHAHFDVNGYRFGDLAYCTDVSRIPDTSWPLLEGLDTLVIDCLRHQPHPAHLSVDEALAVIERLRPRRAFLTHLGHELDHETLSPTLPPNVAMAYDGLSFTFPG